MTTGADVKAARSVWNVWTRVREALKQVRKIEGAVLHIADLEKRVSDLEARLQRCPGDACPHCGALAYRVESVQGIEHEFYRVHYLKCEECGFDDSYIVEGKARR